MELNNFLQLIAVLGVISAIVYGVIRSIKDMSMAKFKEKKEYLDSFESLVAQLTSDNKSAQLAAAILMRRYFDSAKEQGHDDLRLETINVISSLLKILPTGVFQKTLADGLAYAINMSQCDMQEINLQKALLENKKHQLVMDKTDLYLADLSYANLSNIKAHGIILYDAILFCTSIKGCDFTNADFRGADLTGVSFKECILKGANFTNAINVPEIIARHLENGIFNKDSKFTAKHNSNGKTIFFSMPGTMTKEEELITNDYRRLLISYGYNVTYYTRDEYPHFGQFNDVRKQINDSAGMIAFGFKQLHIHSASYRPSTEDSQEWKDKWLSTPWNEIEVGMGLMKGLPILLISDPAINLGVFDRELSECFVGHLSTTEDCRKIEQNKEFVQWKSKIE